MGLDFYPSPLFIYGLVNLIAFDLPLPDKNYQQQAGKLILDS